METELRALGKGVANEARSEAKPEAKPSGGGRPDSFRPGTAEKRDLLRQDRSLGALVRVWGQRNQAIPVAAVASIFDDLLSAFGVESSGSLATMDDVEIDASGVARMKSSCGLETYARMLIEALGAGLGDHAIPPTARSLVARLTSHDVNDHPADIEQLRGWIRDALGAPAPREEVKSLIEAAIYLPSTRPKKNKRSAKKTGTKPSVRREARASLPKSEPRSAPAPAVASAVAAQIAAEVQVPSGTTPEESGRTMLMDRVSELPELRAREESDIHERDTLLPSPVPIETAEAEAQNLPHDSLAPHEAELPIPEMAEEGGRPFDVERPSASSLDRGDEPLTASDAVIATKHVLDFRALTRPRAGVPESKRDARPAVDAEKSTNPADSTNSANSTEAENALKSNVSSFTRWADELPEDEELSSHWPSAVRPVVSEAKKQEEGTSKGDRVSKDGRTDRSGGADKHDGGNANDDAASTTFTTLSTKPSRPPTKSQRPTFTATLRPIIRHRSTRLDPPISLSSAPAARASARALPEGPDSIIVPADRTRAYLPWIVVLLLVGAAVYYFWFAW